MSWSPSVREAAGGLLVLAATAGGWIAQAPGQQVTPDKAAQMVLDSARRAYNQRNHDFAIRRFREFLQKYGSHTEAPAAWYGLGLALLHAPQIDYRQALGAFQRAAGRKDLPDRPYALYYVGFVQRRMGDQSMAEAAARPREADRHRNAAVANYRQALTSFAAAAAAFAERLKTTSTTAPARPAELEWLARARCEQCEMLLRTNQVPEAGKLAEAFLADKAMSATRYRELATYHLGYVRFAQREYLAAGRALSSLAPFRQEFGVHARYLLARTHHLGAERPEAAAQYKALLGHYEEKKKWAQQALQDPRALTADQRARLEALVRQAPPEHILRASFYLALVQAEEGRLAEALTGFTNLLKQYPNCSLAPEAQLRQGFCQKQLRNFAEAMRSLEPLRNHPELSDQATWWLARSRVGAADPANAPVYSRVLRQAIDELRRAADLAGRRASADPDAKRRRGDILMELADTMQLAKQYKEAAAAYHQVLQEKNSPDRGEEAMQRQITALHLGGMYRESDEVCRRFEQAYPRSTLLPAVLFRAAENAYLAATAAADGPGRASGDRAKRLFDEAIKRYQRLVKEYSGFTYVNWARQGMAMAYYRQGRLPQAIESLTAIPEVDRHGALATVPYLLADCYIRTLPSETGDALSAAHLIDRAALAAKLLEGFVGAQPKSPEAPDALLKLGHCYQQIGGVLLDGAERKKVLAQAVGAYDRLGQQYAKSPEAAAACFERAKCAALLGDPNRAMNELRRFQSDPLRNAPVAPLALLRYSVLLRAQNRAPEAVNVMQQCRTRFEGALLNDPARKAWVPMLQYEHALAVMESSKGTPAASRSGGVAKLAEARKMFEALAKQFPGEPASANALWRAAQCRREEVMAGLAAAQQVLGKRGARPEEIAAAERAVQQARRDLRQTVEQFKRQADEIGKKAKGSGAHLRLLYETAWCYRALGDAEVEAARQTLRRSALKKIQAKLARLKPGQPRPTLSAPQVPLSDIPLQPAEKAARQQYQLLIAAAGAQKAPWGELPLAIQARFELAEILATRDHHDAALEMLVSALVSNPPPELAVRIRLRLASFLLASDQPKPALAHIKAVTPKDPKDVGSLAAEARYLAGEAYFKQNNWAKVIETLLPFRDQHPFNAMPDLTDRALLRLGQAFAQVGRWDDSRRSFETLAGRFPQSPWVDEACYGAGWAHQKQRRHDQAVQWYLRITQQTVGEVAARAQLQTGVCRLEQRRFEEAAQALLAVPFTYDYPKLNAAAWCRAAQAYVELKQPQEAAKLWRRVIKDHPESSWAQVARDGLAKIQ